MIEGYSIKNMDTQIISHQAPIKTYIDFCFLFILTKVALIESLKNLTLLQVKKSSAAAWRKHEKTPSKRKNAM